MENRRTKCGTFFIILATILITSTGNIEQTQLLNLENAVADLEAKLGDLRKDLHLERKDRQTMVDSINHTVYQCTGQCNGTRVRDIAAYNIKESSGQPSDKSVCRDLQCLQILRRSFQAEKAKRRETENKLANIEDRYTLLLNDLGKLDEKIKIIPNHDYEELLSKIRNAEIKFINKMDVIEKKFADMASKVDNLTRYGDNNNRYGEKNNARRACGVAKLDIVIVLDASTSVTESNYKKMLSFCKDFLKETDIDSGSVRVGVVIYSTDVQIQFHLNRYSTKAAILQAIDNIPYIFGSTNTADGLNTMRTEMFTQAKGDRPDVRNIALVMTDGISNINARRTIPEAEVARAAGIHIYAIGIGLSDTREIDAIATPPAQDNSFAVQDFNALASLAVKIFSFICPVVVTTPTQEPVPPPTVPPEIFPVSHPVDLPGTQTDPFPSELYSSCHVKNHCTNRQFPLDPCAVILSRAEWGARDTLSVTLMREPAGIVFIHHTVTSRCVLSSICSKEVKKIQNFHMDTNGWDDIGYSFLVGEDGRVYEARGWDRVGAHTYGWNDVAISIAVLGNFNNVLPGENALQAINSLIKCGVGKGKLKTNYKLYGQRDAVRTESPGNMLYNLIKTWPHYQVKPPVRE